MYYLNWHVMETVLESPQTNELSEITPSGDPWDQRVGEPDIHYEYFKIYLGLGRTRSLIKAYKTYMRDFKNMTDEEFESRNSYSTLWSSLSVKWEWRKRSEAYDVDVMSKSDATQIDRTLTARNQRHEIRATLTEKITDLLETIDPTAQLVDPIDVMKMAIAVLGESRDEFEKPLQKKRDNEAAKETALTMAEIIRLSRTAGGSDHSVRESDMPGNETQIPAENPIEAEYREL